MSCRQLSSLTNAVHGTACNTSAGLQVLRSRLGWPKNKHSLEVQFWHLAFTTSTGVTVRLERQVASKASKTITGWWLASNLRSTLLAFECQNNNQKSRALLTQQTWIASGILLEQIGWGSDPISFRKPSEITTLHL